MTMVKMPRSNDDNEMIANKLGQHQQQHTMNRSNNHYDVNAKVDKTNNKEVRSLGSIKSMRMLKSIKQLCRISQDVWMLITMTFNHVLLQHRIMLLTQHKQTLLCIF